MDQPKRKHRATGNPKGGKREGAGRPEGVKNELDYGEVKAIAACRRRVPAEAPAEDVELADEALGHIAAVMRGQVHYLEAGSRLKAATRVREEVCGLLTQKLEHTGADGGPMVVEIHKYTEGDDS